MTFSTSTLGVALSAGLNGLTANQSDIFAWGVGAFIFVTAVSIGFALMNRGRRQAVGVAGGGKKKGR